MCREDAAAELAKLIARMASPGYVVLSKDLALLRLVREALEE